MIAAFSRKLHSSTAHEKPQKSLGRFMPRLGKQFVSNIHARYMPIRINTVLYIVRHNLTDSMPQASPLLFATTLLFHIPVTMSTTSKINTQIKSGAKSSTRQEVIAPKTPNVMRSVFIVVVFPKVTYNAQAAHYIC